jgi:hypothetical protein
MPHIDDGNGGDKLKHTLNMVILNLAKNFRFANTLFYETTKNEYILAKKLLK